MTRVKWLMFAAFMAFCGWSLAQQNGPKAEDPANRSLDANLYMQISAEYRAACHQAYNLATERVKVKSKAVQPQSGLPIAVILDLDETVIDNRGYQSTMIRNGHAFDTGLWLKWEKDHADNVPLVPGAKDFLKLCQDLGVAIVYISNRTEINRAGTKAILEKHGIAVPDDQLLLNESATSSDKTGRRAKAAAKFNVILNVGDNLRDFDERFKFDKDKGSNGRKAEVDITKEKFGTEWIILPNPAYGEWAKAMGQGAKDLNLLSPSVKLGN